MITPGTTSGIPGRRNIRWVVGLLLMVAGMAALGIVVGCGGTPQERYRVLSFFFDGVPDPDAPSRVVTNETGQKVVAATHIVSQHKPYLENRCPVCHNSPNGEVQDFELAYNACVTCHKQVSSEKPWMHGPVARGQCKWCHTGHMSTEAALLRDTPINVCTQCHDSQLLGNNPPEHLDGQTSCLQCHYGHGAQGRYFLKPQPTAPASAPATLPATAPASMPAAEPETQPAASMPGKEPAP